MMWNDYFEEVSDEKAVVFSASSVADIYKLSHTIRIRISFGDRRIPHVASQILQYGLMKSWQTSIVIFFLKVRFGEMWGIKLTEFLERVPELVESLIIDTCNHMEKGKDTEDTNSVGGFSQREINQIVAILQNCGIVSK